MSHGAERGGGWSDARGGENIDKLHFLRHSNLQEARLAQSACACVFVHVCIWALHQQLGCVEVINNNN